MKTRTVFAAILCFTSMVYGQMGTKSLLNDRNSGTAARESVFVQYNASIIFSGEQFQYKLYCMNNATRDFSTMSKMAYIALVSKERESVFVHKVELQNGVGYGDFFIPTSVPTGSYKLLGYSEWMKNGKFEDMFQSDVHIINPYQPIPEAYLEIPLDSLDSIASLNKKAVVAPMNTPITSQHIELTLDKTSLATRSKLALGLKAMNDDASGGNYSLSIRKRPELTGPKTQSAETFYKGFLKREKKITETIDYVPELRGEIISGRVLEKESKLPVPGKKVTLSLPGKEYLLQVSTSNEEGRFYFNIDRRYENSSGALQVLGDHDDALMIAMDEHQPNFGELSFTDFKIGKHMKEVILEKSIQNQIDNAYLEVKADAVVPVKHNTPFYRNLETTYNLDDYTRFSTIQETIIEVVDQVSIKKLDSGEQVFQVRPPEGFTDSGTLPMVFVDGLFLSKHGDFMEYNAKKIKSISFSRDKYLLGTETFQGIISIETLTGDFADTFYAPYLQKVNLFKPQSWKVYFSQEYAENDRSRFERIPDFRNQLLWMPQVDVDSDLELKVYTSDVAGTYEVVLEGFTKNGKPVSIRNWFEVK